MFTLGSKRASSRRNHHLATAALLAALLCASAWISIPIQPVPLTLQVFIVVLSALLLEPIVAFSAVGLYVLMGAAGLPVFSGGTGGLGIIFGPTGGYLLGFVVGATLGSLVRTMLHDMGGGVVSDVIAAGCAIVAIYAFGVAQLMAVQGFDLPKAFMLGAVPFLALDVAKAATALVVAFSLRRAGVAPSPGYQHP